MKKCIKKYMVCRRMARVVVLGVSLALGACSLNIPPADLYSDPDAIVNVQNARSLLTSAYLAYPQYGYELATLGPDFCPTSLTGKDALQRNLYEWQDKTISGFSDVMWLEFYNTIAVCDVLLERMPQVVVTKAEEEQAKAAIVAEANILKAMCYFNLLRLYAPAYDRNLEADGIILKTRVGVEFPKRSSIQECTEFVRGLLKEAVQVENRPEANGWLSQVAGWYLLAELELYAGNFEEAARYAELVMAEGKDELFTEMGFQRLWETASTPERIFAFFVSNPVYTGLQYDAEEGDFFMVSPKVVFAADDYRQKWSLFPFVMQGEERALLGKYNRNNKEGKNTAYLNVFRFAGAYFMAAEAYARIPGQSAKAVAVLNRYLSSCGADVLDGALSGDALVKAVLNEKLKEFVGEGVLFLDYKRLHWSMPRWGRWGKQQEDAVKPDDFRWTFPIPASEYKFNENVTQNEGWPLNRNQ